MSKLIISMALPSNKFFGRTDLNDEQKKYLYDIFLRRVHEKERSIIRGKPTKALKLYILDPNGNSLDEFHVKPPSHELKYIAGEKISFNVIVKSPAHKHSWNLFVSLEAFEASLEKVDSKKRPYGSLELYRRYGS